MASLKNILKKNTIIIGFILIILLFVFCGTVAIKGLVTVGNFTRTIYDHPLVVSNASLLALVDITEMHASMGVYVLAPSFQKGHSALKTVSEKEQKIYQQLDAIQNKTLGQEGQMLAQQIRQLFTDWKPIRQEIVRLFESGNKKDAIRLTNGKEADHVVKLKAKILQLSAYARQKADTFMASGEATQLRLEKMSIALTLAGIFFSLIIAVATTLLVLNTETVLQQKKEKLQKALDEIKTLHGIIPICSHCKQIRDDKGLWKRMEEDIHEHSDAKFSHGICPHCIKKYYANP